ncbi:hypothetical protein ACLMAL_18390 [Nocardia sp. CWNU-33]|uniref:hypothetical protein n=1 Tax=Nocardia sp. CWNU-33 TaxID=3392117 RepID=UPI00398E9976
MLSEDGVTILLPFSGRTEEGVYYDGVSQIRPDDPRYAELLPLAEQNPQPRRTRPSGPVDPDTAARIQRALGLE